MAVRIMKGYLDSPSLFHKDPHPNAVVNYDGPGTRSSSGSVAASRPGSADIRPKLAAAPFHKDTHEHLPGASTHQQLPGIFSLLNEPNRIRSQDVPRTMNGRYPAPYNSPKETSASRPYAAEVQRSQISSESRLDAPRPALYERPSDSHHSYETSAKTSPGSAETNYVGYSPPAGSPRSCLNRQEALEKPTSLSAMPHYVPTRDDRDQSTAYVYSDGSASKTVVNGQPVKRELGVTKLGNPRKRQAEACIACRSKKIKCERVGSTRECAHCTKQKVKCRWARSSGASPEPDDDLQHPQDLPNDDPSSGSVYGGRFSQSTKESPTRSTSHYPISTGDIQVEGKEDDQISKKPRLSTKESHSTYWECGSSRFAPAFDPRRERHELFDGETDPFVTSPDISQQLLDMYFDYRDSHTATMLPRNAFTRWCYTCNKKSTTDRMLIYAILALGSVFSTSIELKGVSQSLADIARRLERREFSNFSLQLAQARLHLALYHWAKGSANHSFEYTDAGCRVLSALGYNTEEGCRSDVSPNREENDYHLSPAEAIECRRRTFWIGYMTERYNGYCSGHAGIISNRDVWVALPNLEIDFESGINRIGPMFNNGECDLTECGAAALLAGIGSIWGDVAAECYRSIYRSTFRYVQHHTSFHLETSQRLAAWESALPRDYKLCNENTLRNIKGKDIASYYVVHACHLITAMKINRYGNAKLLSAEIVRQNIRNARYYAKQLLELVSTVARSDAFPPAYHTRHLENALYQPFPAYAILGACDILSARGKTSALSEAQSQLGHAKTIVSECAKFFNSAKQQKRMIDSRLGELGAHVAMKHSYNTQPTWRFAEPIEKTFIPVALDLIYSVDDQIYYSALEEEPLMAAPSATPKNRAGSGS